MYQRMQRIIKGWLSGGRKSRETVYIAIDGLEEADLKNYLLRKFHDEQQRVGVTMEIDQFCCRLPRSLTDDEREEINFLRSANAPSTGVTEESSDEKNKEAARDGRDHRSNRSSALVGRDEKTRRDQRQSRQSQRAADAKIRSDYMDGLN